MSSLRSCQEPDETSKQPTAKEQDTGKEQQDEDERQSVHDNEQQDDTKPRQGYDQEQVQKPAQAEVPEREPINEYEKPVKRRRSDADNGDETVMPASLGLSHSIQPLQAPRQIQSAPPPQRPTALEQSLPTQHSTQERAPVGVMNRGFRFPPVRLEESTQEPVYLPGPPPPPMRGMSSHYRTLSHQSQKSLSQHKYSASLSPMMQEGFARLALPSFSETSPAYASPILGNPQMSKTNPLIGTPQLPKTGEIWPANMPSHGIHYLPNPVEYSPNQYVYGGDQSNMWSSSQQPNLQQPPQHYPSVRPVFRGQHEFQVRDKRKRRAGGKRSLEEMILGAQFPTNININQHASVSSAYGGRSPDMLQLSLISRGDSDSSEGQGGPGLLGKPTTTLIPLSVPQPPLSKAAACSGTTMNSDAPPRSKKKSKYTKEQDDLIIKMKVEGSTWADIAEATKCSNAIAARNRYQVLIGQQGGKTVLWQEEDATELQRLLEYGEVAKWEAIAHELGKQRNKKFTSKDCRSKISELFSSNPGIFNIAVGQQPVISPYEQDWVPPPPAVTSNDEQGPSSSSSHYPQAGPPASTSNPPTMTRYLSPSSQQTNYGRYDFNAPRTRSINTNFEPEPRRESGSYPGPSE